MEAFLKEAVSPLGAFIVWRWGDDEIENPMGLRNQLDEIQSKGFSGVFVTLRGTRYELIDRKVIRAVTQVSQWAKKRGLSFWLQADPRQASRALITKTGERLQCLILHKNLKRQPVKKPNITRIKNNQFELHFAYPRIQYARNLQEISLHLEPIGLEKAFAFRKKGNVIIESSVRDITAETRTFFNMVNDTIEVFGEVRVPEDESWWVMAFPKLNTNMFDYAGRESKDLFHLLIEDFFDAGAYLDGVTWDEIGLNEDIDQFPVSDSMYNCFLLEFGYDLRDALFALVMETDQALHIQVRCDYYAFLMDMAFEAQYEFLQMLHSFFGVTEMGLANNWDLQNRKSSRFICGNIDPWYGIRAGNIGLTEIDGADLSNGNFGNFISRLVITKSLGAFSMSQKAYSILWKNKYRRNELMYSIDLMSLFSIRWMVHAFGKNTLVDKFNKYRSAYPADNTWEDFDELNWKIDLIERITQYRFPQTNVALIFPVETIMVSSLDESKRMIQNIFKLITRLTIAGIQIDVISPIILEKSYFSYDGLSIGSRKYDALIFPYPEVLSQNLVKLISNISRSKFPLLLGGKLPKYTTTGKQIPFDFKLNFDPESNDLSPFYEYGIQPMIQLPENSLGTLINTPEGLLYLLCPNVYNGTMEGEVKYREHSYQVPKSNGLVILRQDRSGDIEQIL